MPGLAGPVLSTARRRRVSTPNHDQLGLFATTQHPVVDELRRVDPNTLTPLAALQLVADLVQRAKS